MANDKLIVDIDLEKGDTKKATQGLKSDVAKAGAVSGAAFGRRFNAGVSTALGSIGSILKNNLGLITAFIGVFTGRAVIQAASRQEDAINALNSALSITKNAGLDASQGIQEFASELQQVSRFGDEVLLENAALIQSLGDLDEKGLKRATKAAADLATALRIDLNAAATLVGKAAAGEVGSFSRYGVSIKKAETNALTFSRALDAIEEKFGGAAERDVNTFSGAVDQLGNSFGDLLEKVGETLTKNDSFINILKGLTGFINGAINNFDTFVEVVKSIGVGFLEFAKILNTFVTPAIITVKDTFRIIGEVGLTVIARIIQGAFRLANAVGKIASFFGGDNAFSSFTQSLQEQADRVAQTQADITNKVIGESFDLTSTTAAIDTQITLLQDSLNNRNEIVDQANEKLVQGQEQASKKLIESTRKAGKEVANVAQQTFDKGVANAVSGGIQNIINSLAKGEDVFSNFGKFLLNTFGDLAIQLGQFYILQSTALKALLALDPTGGLSLGIALVALGSILKSFGGSAETSSGGATSGVAPIGAEPAPGELETPLADPESIAERQTRVTINVEGNLVRQEELGSFISDVLSESNAKNSNIITDFRTA